MILIMFLVFSCPWQPPFQSILWGLAVQCWHLFIGQKRTNIMTNFRKLNHYLSQPCTCNWNFGPFNKQGDFRLLRRELRGNEMKCLPVRQLSSEIQDTHAEQLQIHNYFYLLGRQGLLQNGRKTFLFSTSGPCFGYFWSHKLLQNAALSPHPFQG